MCPGLAACHCRNCKIFDLYQSGLSVFNTQQIEKFEATQFPEFLSTVHWQACTFFESILGILLLDMINFFLIFFSRPLFTFSLPFPFFLFPAAQGMFQSFRTKKQSVGVYRVLDSTAWSTGAHMSSRNYSIMRRVSTCKQDATVELLVLPTHFLFFEIRGQKSSSAPEGWHGSQGVLHRDY